MPQIKLEYTSNVKFEKDINKVLSEIHVALQQATWISI